MNNDSLSAVVGKDGPIRPLKNVEAQVPREEEFGVRNPRKLPDPKLPSKEEVERHYPTHLPFRNWCQYCIQGKGKTAPHFQQGQCDDGLMEVRFDYCFMSTHGSPMCTILVAKEKSSKMTLATVVPMKGASLEYPIRRTMTFLKEIGLEGADIVVKSDQENASKDFLNNIAARRSAKSKIEKTDGPLVGSAGPLVASAGPSLALRGPSLALRGPSLALRAASHVGKRPWGKRQVKSKEIPETAFAT